MMNFRQRKTILWCLFSCALLGAIWGWLLIMQRLVENESEISQARVREVEERYLAKIAERFYAIEHSEAPVTEEDVKKGAASGSYAGVWTERFVSLPSTGAVSQKEWDIQEQDVDSSELLEVLVAAGRKVSWGVIEDGRDRLGSLLLKLIRKEGDQFLHRELLERGVWDYDTGSETLNPAFRLLLIRELEKIAPSEKLKRLKVAEKIRAVEGNVEELSETYEVLSYANASWFFTRSQLAELFEEPGVTLLAERPDDRTSVRVNGFRHWPYLCFEGRFQEGGGASKKNSQAILWVGAVTGGLVLGIVLLAIWMGNYELKRARARTGLAASVAHELRTPLAGQRVVLENLQNRATGFPEQDQESLEMALRENERLSGLAEEFLTFSRLERGVLKVECHSIKLQETLVSVIESFEKYWDEEDTVEVVLDPLMSSAFGDEVGVSTIARNLIENAWKYSETPRRILIASLENENEVGFQVRDNGKGLSQTDEQRVFRQFYRVDQKLSRRQDGLGLGLSIVKRLVEGMNGRVVVESELGKGTTFSIYFQKGKS